MQENAPTPPPLPLPQNSSSSRAREVLTRQWLADTPEGDQAPRAVIGIDIGGTKLAWAAFELNPDGSIGGKLTGTDGKPVEGNVPTPHGIEPLVDRYAEVLQQAMYRLRGRAALAGVGVCTPGRYISEKTYAEKKYEPPKRAATVSSRFGNVNTTRLEDMNALSSIEGGKVIANGSARRLGTTPDEFDGLALESLLAGVTPKGVRVMVDNDAAVQLCGLVDALHGDAERQKLVDGRKLIYFGPGSGVGAAVMDKDGTLVTDGHFQYIKFSSMREGAADRAIFEETSMRHMSRYGMQAGWLMGEVQPEDMFSGTDIAKLLAPTLKMPEPHDRDQVRAVMQEADRLYAEGKMPPEALARLEAIGRALGDFFGVLHKGRFTHMDPRAEWDEGDKAHVQGFETVVLGGGLAKAPFYQEVVLPKAREVLNERGLSHIDIVTPGKNTLDAVLAAAANISSHHSHGPWLATEHIRTLHKDSLSAGRGAA